METASTRQSFTKPTVVVLPAPASPSQSDANLIMKYKTELCRNWSKGYCEYGKNCLFAHGSDEMRPKHLPNRYKTKFCVNILRDGHCKYGSRCLFRHGDDSLNRTRDSDSVSGENSSEWVGRLPVFVDIERRCV